MSINKNELTIQIGTVLNKEGYYVEIMENGPYVLHGSPKIVQLFIMPDAQGISIAYKEGKEFTSKDKVKLCRCGLSKSKPYCDGTHKQAQEYGVDLRERATFDPELATAQEIKGPVVSLTDDEKLCAFARFCDNEKRIWNQVEDASTESVELSIQMAHHCPGGRLIVWDKNNKPIEKDNLPPVLGLIEDVANGCSGPIALWGGIPVKSVKERFYEVRNRQTLCRCGQSSNKPFCDGTHASMKFQDGLPKHPEVNGKVF